MMIEAVNELLIKNYNGGTITIRQTDIVALFLEKVKGSAEKWTSSKVSDKRQLDIEPLYKQYGWKVRYDKPGYNESGEACFEFIPKIADQAVPGSTYYSHHAVYRESGRDAILLVFEKIIMRHLALFVLIAGSITMLTQVVETAIDLSNHKPPKTSFWVSIIAMSAGWTGYLM